MHYVIIDNISENISSLVQLGKYGSINASDPTTMVYYVIKYLSKPYTPTEEKYLSIMKLKIDCYWKQHGTNKSFIISTHTIVDPCLEVSVINNTSDITRSIRNKKKSLQAVHRQPICTADVDHDYIIDIIERHDHIEYERKIQNDDK